MPSHVWTSLSPFLCWPGPIQCATCQVCMSVGLCNFHIWEYGMENTAPILQMCKTKIWIDQVKDVVWPRPHQNESLIMWGSEASPTFLCLLHSSLSFLMNHWSPRVFSYIKRLPQGSKAMPTYLCLQLSGWNETWHYSNWLGNQSFYLLNLSDNTLLKSLLRAIKESTQSLCCLEKY